VATHLEPSHEGVRLEHLQLSAPRADAVVFAFDKESGPFRLRYRLAWETSWRLREAEWMLETAHATCSLILHRDGSGFQAELPVDEDGVVLGYPGLHRRVRNHAA
jgi:hypothetical protein